MRRPLEIILEQFNDKPIFRKVYEGELLGEKRL